MSYLAMFSLPELDCGIIRYFLKRPIAMNFAFVEVIFMILWPSTSSRSHLLFFGGSNLTAELAVNLAATDNPVGSD
jgi:hypothetical protein